MYLIINPQTKEFKAPGFIVLVEVTLIQKIHSPVHYPPGFIQNIEILLPMCPSNKQTQVLLPVYKLHC